MCTIFSQTLQSTRTHERKHNAFWDSNQFGERRLKWRSVRVPKSPLPLQRHLSLAFGLAEDADLVLAMWNRSNASNVHLHKAQRPCTTHGRSDLVHSCLRPKVDAHILKDASLGSAPIHPVPLVCSDHQPGWTWNRSIRSRFDNRAPQYPLLVHWMNL